MIGSHDDGAAHLPEAGPDSLLGDIVDEAVSVVGDIIKDVVEALVLPDDDHPGPAHADCGHAPDPASDRPAAGGAVTAPLSPAAGTDHAGLSVEYELTAVYLDPTLAGGNGADTVHPGSDPAAGGVTEHHPTPEHGPTAHADPVITDVAGHNPAAADTMAFIQGVMHADPAQLDRMNAQLQGITAQDQIHNSVAQHDAAVADGNAYHQAIEDADQASTEAESVLNEGPEPT